MLIIPLIHSPTFTSIADPEARKSTYDEMQRYRNALNNMVRKKSKSSLGSVTWEVSRGNGIHVHWQYLPVASDLIAKGLVEAAFKVEAENLQYPKITSSSNEDGANEVGDYFRVWISRPAGRSRVEERWLGKDFDSAADSGFQIRFAIWASGDGEAVTTRKENGLEGMWAIDGGRGCRCRGFQGRLQET